MTRPRVVPMTSFESLDLFENNPHEFYRRIRAESWEKACDEYDRAHPFWPRWVTNILEKLRNA